MSGIGVVTGLVSVAPMATISAGNGNVGTLSFADDLTLSALPNTNTTFAVTSAGGASNRIAVAGALTPNGSVVRIVSGAPLTGYSTNTLFTYGSISGAFNPAPVFDVPPAHSAAIMDDGAGHSIWW